MLFIFFLFRFLSAVFCCFFFFFDRGADTRTALSIYPPKFLKNLREAALQDRRDFLLTKIFPVVFHNFLLGWSFHRDWPPVGGFWISIGPAILAVEFRIFS